MKKHTIFLSLLLVFGIVTGCEKEKELLNQVNPNQPSLATFWKTENDAIAGINAVYAGIQDRRITLWELFHYNNRSDEGYSQSPWGDLANVGAFIFNDYNIPFNREMYEMCYRVIYRANQVLAYVPAIQMDETRKKGILAEAKFLRGHIYYKLVTLWGSVPVVTAVQTKDDRPEQGTAEQVWAQIVTDFSEAKTDLPTKDKTDIGRATKGGAAAYLGKAYLQQKKWAEAAAQFKEITDGVHGAYSLVDFKDNFTELAENNAESLFEIQYTNNNGKVSGFPVYDAAGADETSERAQFFGVRTSDFSELNVPNVAGWCDAQPTKWLLNQFLIEPDKNGNVDPRLQYTLFYDHPGELVFGVPYKNLPSTKPGDDGVDPEQRFWKKYTTYYKSDNGYFSGVNDRVIRLADVYLMYAECLNEQNNPTEAITWVNKVRARSNMKDLPLLSAADFRPQMEHERVLELAGESVRYVDMMRFGTFGGAKQLADLQPNLPPNKAAYDTEFKNYVPGKTYLPIPLYEIDANNKVKQVGAW